jgi:protein tyrosine phosphatase (PTP) superfamily phosphohydrolase (DUF442 family)
VPIHRPGLENACWLTDTVLSGAQPEGDAAFRELAALGVRTVISVDGVTPDAEAARRHGLRTVHLPIGYDGVPVERARELAKAIVELPGPIYIHCHHGLHRSPAAAAVACVVAGRLNNDQAVAAMRTLGTGSQYRGLWDSAREARPMEIDALRRLPVTFREAAPIPPLAEAMVGLDDVFDRLQLCSKAGWKKPADHPDVDPPHEALRAREICAEIMRTEDFKSRPEEFRKLMETSRAAAETLELRLRAADPAADQAFAALTRACADCHKPFRNARSRK